MNIRLDIETIFSADVVVVGGGTAGVFAAIAAAKTGAKTLLIEKNTILGGTMTMANICFPGLFFAWGKQIISGPCWDSILQAASFGGATLPEISYKPKHHWDEQIPLNRFVYTTVLFKMCEEAGVEVICNSMLSHAESIDNGVRLIVTGKKGVFLIDTKVAIDTTGDANLTEIMGYPLQKSETLQPTTLHNRIGGYNIEDVTLEDIKEAYKNANLPSHIVPEALYNHLKSHFINIHTPCPDADTSEGKTRLEMNAHYDLLRVVNFYKSIKGLEGLHVSFAADETGVRETNRIVGETVISAEDYINGYLYPDSICYAFYPIDLHVMKGIEQQFHKENVVSKIPYSALIPKGSKRLLVAGRCMSSDTLSNSALRVEAPCMATGQAAGCAAAIAAARGIDVADVNYVELCNKLEAIGAIVPKE